jgi:MFS family permease
MAVWLCRSIPNRRSLALKFVSREPAEHVNYRYRPMWLLIWFECAWRIGRVALGAFTTAYLLDYFGLQLDRIILIYMLVNVMNIFMLYVVGRVSDRVGNRHPLAIITCICTASMLLWVGSAWWGLWPVIAYQIINGMAGSTHWMLLTNLSLQVYPAKGRANFLSFSRTVVGVMLMAGATFAGYLMSLMRGWSITLWGADFKYYHVFFLGCTIFTFGCLIPLWFLGKMTMPTPEESIVTENGA